jgi:hypothetical protein
MKDERLIGYWSEAELNPSSPELTELGFRGDGSGWLYWSSWSTAFVVYRFNWRMPAPGRITTRLRLAVDGAWSLAGDETRHRIERWQNIDTTVTLACEIEPGPKLTLDRPLDDALGGTEFLAVPAGGTDPTLATPPP